MAEVLPIANVTAKSKHSIPHISTTDATAVKRPNMSPIYHSGLQAVIWGAGEPGENKPTFDPLKKTLYVDFGEDAQAAVRAGIEAVEGPKAPERPEPGDELGDKMKEGAEASEKELQGPAYQPNQVYMGGDGINEWDLETDSNGKVKDTVKYNTGAHKFDTIPVKKHE